MGFIDHVVRLSDCIILHFVLVETMNFSLVICSSRQQYRDYIIDLYRLHHQFVQCSKIF